MSWPNRPKHGHATVGKISPEYNSWRAMIERCTNPKSQSYYRYGGRGITVCSRWLGKGGFINFLADLGLKPTPRHTIERTDNDGNYEPGNCRWATRKEQNENTKAVQRLTFNGQTLTIRQWADKLSLPRGTLKARLGRLKWSVEKALTTPLMGLFGVRR